MTQNIAWTIYSSVFPSWLLLQEHHLLHSYLTLKSDSSSFDTLTVQHKENTAELKWPHRSNQSQRFSDAADDTPMWALNQCRLIALIAVFWLLHQSSEVRLFCSAAYETVSRKQRGARLRHKGKKKGHGLKLKCLPGTGALLWCSLPCTSNDGSLTALFGGVLIQQHFTALCMDAYLFTFAQVISELSALAVLLLWLSLNQIMFGCESNPKQQILMELSPDYTVPGIGGIVCSTAILHNHNYIDQEVWIKTRRRKFPHSLRYLHRFQI